MSRVAIVTGAARGIGAAIVHALAEDGMQVVAVDLCADDVALPYALATPADMEALGAAWPGRVHPVVADVRELQALSRAVADAEHTLGGVDVAVAAAGAIAGGRPLWQTDPAILAALWEVNLRGVWNLAAATVPAMLRRREPRAGRFVALASAAAHRGLWHLSAYCSAKHAVIGLVRGLAADLRGTGVNAVAVSPGATDTEMLCATAELYGLDGIAALADGHLVGRVLDPPEVAAAVRWVCSPDSAAVTGTVVHADGGFTA